MSHMIHLALASLRLPDNYFHFLCQRWKICWLSLIEFRVLLLILIRNSSLEIGMNDEELRR